MKDCLNPSSRLPIWRQAPRVQTCNLTCERHNRDLTEIYPQLDINNIRYEKALQHASIFITFNNLASLIWLASAMPCMISPSPCLPASLPCLRTYITYLSLRTGRKEMENFARGFLFHLDRRKGARKEASSSIKFDWSHGKERRQSLTLTRSHTHTHIHKVV